MSFKSGYIALIGRTNVGKSSILNRISQINFAPVTSRKQTTRENLIIINNRENSQQIFIDTPGYVKPKNLLDKSLLKNSLKAMEEADIIAFVTDIRSHIDPMDYEILERLKKFNKPVFLLINKIDMEISLSLKIISEFSKLYEFCEIIPISAKKNDGIDLFLDLIEKYLPSGEPFYPVDYITDKSQKSIAETKIREKALIFLSQEVPHGINISIDKFKEGKKIYIEATIYVEKQSHKKIVIGKDGSMLKNIRTYSEEDLTRLFDREVRISLWIKVSKNWRKTDMVEKFGY